MTPTATPTRTRWRPAPALTVALVAAGCAALLVRPALLPEGQDPTALLVWLFVFLGVAGAAWPLPTVVPEWMPSRRTALGVLCLGSVAFLLGWAATGGPDATYTLLFHAVALNALAAVAEEAFFRRLVYGVLLPFGPAVAVAGSAVAFAVVHVTVWGFWVLPLDLAAGLLLSWQRAGSGRWWVPAVTHVLANTLALV